MKQTVPISRFIDVKRRGDIILPISEKIHDAYLAFKENGDTQALDALLLLSKKVSNL